MDSGMKSAMPESDSGVNFTQNTPVEQMTEDLEDWREVVLHMEGVLNWERPKVLVGLISLVTLLFILFWWSEPSILTTVALLGLVATALDFGVPLLSQKLSHEEWSHNEQQQYREICRRLVNFKSHVIAGVTWLMNQRRERPSVFYPMVLFALLVVGAIGQQINNLFLTWVCILVALLVPGLRQRGILQQVTANAIAMVKEKIGQRKKTQ